MPKVTYIDEVDIKDKTILLRVDFNVSLSKNKRLITDDQRITSTLDTIKHLLKNKNRLILISHLGRPDGHFDPKYSLQIVCDRLAEYLKDYKIRLINDFLTEKETTFKLQQNDEIFVLENIRFYKGEKENDKKFCQNLAKLADCFVNDAFGACHRKDASIYGVAKYLPSYGGLLLKKEVAILNMILTNPKKPMLAIIGGSKIDSKINLIKKIVEIADYVFIGGALSNTLLSSMGVDVKDSLYEGDKKSICEEIFKNAKYYNHEIILPVDFVCGDKDNFEKDGVICEKHNIPDKMAILDIGPKTRQLLHAYINKCKTVVWNGPVGLFENIKYQEGTDSVFYSISTAKHLTSVIGGGDTLSAISKQKDLGNITHISTGGGAMLEYMEKNTLPGIDVLGR
jgi:phosphoglycerate kinase